MTGARRSVLWIIGRLAIGNGSDPGRSWSLPDIDVLL